MSDAIIPIMKLSVKLLKIISDSEQIAHYVVNLKKSELNKENKELEKMIIDYTELSLSIVYDAVDREIEKRGNKKC